MSIINFHNAPQYAPNVGLSDKKQTESQRVGQDDPKNQTHSRERLKDANASDTTKSYTYSLATSAVILEDETGYGTNEFPEKSQLVYLRHVQDMKQEQASRMNRDELFSPLALTA